MINVQRANDVICKIIGCTNPVIRVGMDVCSIEHGRLYQNMANRKGYVSEEFNCESTGIYTKYEMSPLQMIKSDIKSLVRSHTKEDSFKKEIVPKIPLLTRQDILLLGRYINKYYDDEHFQYIKDLFRKYGVIF